MGLPVAYNPIIQAMMASARQNTENAKLQQEQEAQKQNIASQKLADAARDRQLDLLKSHNEATAEHEKGMLGVQQQLAEAQLEANRLTRLKQGYELTKFLPHLNESLQSIGGAPIAGMPNQGEAQQNEIDQLHAKAQAQSSGAAEGALPYQLQLGEAKHNQDLESKLQDHAHKMLQIEATGGNAQKMAQIHGGYQQSVANINGANHLRGIALMHSLGMDDGSGSGGAQARDLLDGVYNGTIDYSKMSKDEKKAVDAYASANGELKGLPTDTKSYAKKLDTVSGLQTIIDQYRDLANNFSRDSPGASAGGNQNVTLPIVGTLQRTKPGSDLESKLASMKSSGGQLASYFDQQNRKSDAEILRQVTGAFDPKATVQQNLEKLTAHTSQLQQAVKNTFVGMTPDRVNKVLGDRNITDFGAFTPIQAQAPNGHMIESHDNKKTWIDSVTKQPYVPAAQ